MSIRKWVCPSIYTRIIPSTKAVSLINAKQPLTEGTSAGIGKFDFTYRSCCFCMT